MDKIKEKILKIIQNSISETDFLLVDLNIRGDQRKRIIEVFVDSSKNVSADDLAELSSKINETLSETEEIGNYRLDVSTPGVDRPLKFIEQYPKNVNRNFELEYHFGNEVKKVKARLVSVNGNELTFNDGRNEFLINYNQIIKAKVLISFS
ncbi:MAG: ribosome maturation factor RimP [Ignavibacterium sp.]|uniref:ribosome maturation factor RimP n=1 Tax=Ignavibacterium sp. TaxID=2651167 RepID=UPI00404AA687